MKKLMCEVCGSSQIVKEATGFVCKDCGCGYTAEQVRGLLVEVPDQQPAPKPAPAPIPTHAPAAVSANDQLDKLYTLARRAREQDNRENAARYYDMIALQDPNNWEASFFQVYYNSANCKIAEIASAAMAVVNCQKTVMQLIRDHVPAAEQFNAVTTVVQYTIALATTFFNAAENFYYGIADSVRYQYNQELFERIRNATDCVYFCGDAIEQMFPRNEKLLLVASKTWLEANVLGKRLKQYAADQWAVQKVINTYETSAIKYDPELRKQKKQQEDQSLNNRINETKKTIQSLENAKIQDEENRPLRIFFYVMSPLSGIAMLALFTVLAMAGNFIGMLACFIPSIVLPILFLNAGKKRKLTSDDTDRMLRDLRRELDDLERQKENR